MQPEWTAAGETGSGRVWREILQPLGEDLKHQARDLSLTTVARVAQIVHMDFAEPTRVEQVRANAESLFLAIADSIAAGREPVAIELPEGLEAGARTWAQRGFPLAPLLRGFRFMHEDVADWMHAAIAAHPATDQDRQAAAALASKWLFAAVDGLATRYGQVYETEREAWHRSAAALRVETIAAILAGAEGDSARASTRLGYELNRHHLALIAWVEADSDNVSGQQAMESEIERFAASSHADGSLMDPMGTRAVMAWVSRAAPFAERALGSALRRQGQVSLAIGEPAFGLAGFRRSHIEATHARRVATMLHRARRTTRYGRVELLAIASLDPDRTRGFVERVLGELTRDDDATRRLTSTLGVYLSENCSRSRAAKRLGLHENTITYRIRRTQEILGRPVESDSLRLSAALALLPAVGESR